MKLCTRMAASFAVAVTVAAAGSVWAQEVPAEYKTVLTSLGKTGDFKDGVLK